MATLQVRDMDDHLYNYLRTSAKLQHRSISQEVITILQDYLNAPLKQAQNATLAFLALEGGWKDDRSAQEIVEDMRATRTTTNRFGGASGLFD